MTAPLPVLGRATGSKKKSYSKVVAVMLTTPGLARLYTWMLISSSAVSAAGPGGAAAASWTARSGAPRLRRSQRRKASVTALDRSAVTRMIRSGCRVISIGGQCSEIDTELPMLMSSVMVRLEAFGTVMLVFILSTGMLTRYSPGGMGLGKRQVPWLPLVLIGDEVKVPFGPTSVTTWPSR